MELDAIQAARQKALAGWDAEAQSKSQSPPIEANKGQGPPDQNKEVHKL